MQRKTFDLRIRNGLKPCQLIETLAPYISAPRLLKIEEVLDARIRGITVALEGPSDIHNALAVVRTSEALGVDRLHMIAPEGNARKGWSTTKGALNWMQVHYHDDVQGFAQKEKEQGFLLAGASLEGSMDLEELPLDRPLCVLFGNEHRGLSEEAQSMCDLLYRIPMYGMTQSYNLSVSAALSLSKLLERKRAALGRLGDLSEIDRELERAWYYVRALSGRLVENLLK